ncbi:phosphate system positive regulatory protein pho81 [Modicella reniformis]|uniref:Phosphate system positive regulatory protein pho81 n=1 Tax=Modicella reniformis TaxID=1440133 RepID=A0A9P6IVP1_9FUNG|nr:phosphate system positive regulatory protein pho81 [Modicella reniformis]
MDDLDMDFIPSLSLPPPIIPFRIYGHNYLDKKYQINLTLGHPNYPDHNSQDKTGVRQPPVHLYDGREVFGFQVDSLEHFTVEFDIYPTFGSKAIGRAVALPSIFSSQESSMGKGVLPLFDAHLKVVGELAFEYSVIRPFQGVRLEVGGRVETYWKSTNSIDHTTSRHTFGHAWEYIQLSIQMTRNFVPVVFANWQLPVEGFDLAVSDVSFNQFKRFGELIHQRAAGEDFEAAASRMASSWRSGEWRRKIYERWMSLDQVLKILPKHIGVNLELKYPTLSERTHYRLTNCVEVNKFVDTILQTVYDSSSATHHRSFMFSSFNPVICSALNWKQPNYAVFFSTYCGYNKSKSRAPRPIEDSTLGLKRKEPIDPESLPPPKHGSAATPLSSIAATTSSSVSKAESPLLPRSAADSLTTPSNDSEFHEDDKRCTSIKEAVKFARGNSLLGVICEATPLIQVPSLITHVKESGLIISSFGPSNKDPALVQLQKSHGVDAFMVLDDINSGSKSPVSSTSPPPPPSSASPSSSSSSSSSMSSSSVGMTGLGLGKGSSRASTTAAGSAMYIGSSIPDVEEGVLRYQNGVDSGSFNL